MGRNRVLSFMSQFSVGNKTPSPPPSSSTPPSDESLYSTNSKAKMIEAFANNLPDFRRPVTPPSHSEYGSPLNSPPRSGSHQRQRSNSRPLSIVHAYQPTMMDINEDTIPELQPIFTFLNSHSNKLYYEGYFLKLDDQNTQGKPNLDRTWNECFAQLVGTVLSLWDAAELDAAGEDGEVLPKFINLTDASIKMIDSVLTRSDDATPLQNVLSISTAGRNRYLLHFNSQDSLVDWTAAIRLAMYEHSTLQEAYTGALIAGKGKSLNNINIIMERSRFKTEEWVRVRFGAGVPWRRCWCVITPPDEKEYAKLQKELKKRSPYDRSAVPVLKGHVKFYDNKTEGKRQKKTQPIASITEAYSAYAIYPQAKSLVDASTLIKIEGNISIHTDPSSSSEGFVFVMPETRPAVSGFETMLQFLFRTWDTFGLYGRPGKLIASVLDSRSIMFALPKHKRYGYLELQDVSGLLLDDKSSSWNEREWWKSLKDATSARMTSIGEGTRSHSRSVSRTSARMSFGNSNGVGKSRVGFAGDDGLQLRTSSDSNSPERAYSSSPLSNQSHLGLDTQTNSNRSSSDEERGTAPSPPVGPVESMRTTHTPEPVVKPPAFNHSSQDRLTSKAYHSPELRRANSRLSSSTLALMAKAGGISMPEMTAAPDFSTMSLKNGRPDGPAVPSPDSNFATTSANGDGSHEDLGSKEDRPPSTDSNQRSESPYGLESHHLRGPDPFPLLDNTPHQDEHGPCRPSSGPTPYSGNEDEGPPGHPHRKPLSARTAEGDKHKSITPSDIIDHYDNQSWDQYDRSSPMPPLPPSHHVVDEQATSYDEPDFLRTSPERPRAGVLKTVGGAELQPKPDFNLPDVDFGRTINFGAASVFRTPGLDHRQGQRPHTPTDGQLQSGHRRQKSDTMAWQPAASPTGPRSRGLTAEQFVQQRAAAATSPYGHGRKLSANMLGGRSASSSTSPSHSSAPQPVYQAMGP